jgi:hypothetical protein
MKIKGIKEQLLLTIIVVEIYIALIFLFFYPRDGELPYFGITQALIKTRDISLAFGGLLVLLRILRIFRNPRQFVYVLVTFFNIIGFIVAFVLTMSKEIDKIWLHLTLLNLLIGAIMSTDLLFHQSGLVYPTKTKIEKNSGERKFS